MGEQETIAFSDPEHLRRFMKCLLNDLRALEQMIADGCIETGVRRIGAEQEMFLVDDSLRPALVSMDVLDAAADSRFTPELGQFNLEFNLDPMEFGGDCLRRLERDLNASLEHARASAASCGADVYLGGILPTLSNADLTTEAMAPLRRYAALNEAMQRLRGEDFEFRVSGTDEVIINHDSIMLESCNTSCQFHFQVSPDEFARLYNIAQLVTAPVLAVAANSPLLFGRRLWQETRIALFQQAVDTRRPAHHVQERTARVSFGKHWVKESVLEIFQEDIARFRVVVGIDIDENPFDMLEQGKAPKLRALQLHNGTVYRWNRPCYGVLDGKPHLRIENRALPSGPSTLDEVANAAFWFGLVSCAMTEFDDITRHMDFSTAKQNFMAAAHQGLDAQFSWIDGRRWTAQELILKRLIPCAHAGLKASGIDIEDVDRYIGVIETRASTGQTGARWMLDSFADLKDKAPHGQVMRAITGASMAYQKEGMPVHDWSPARLNDAGGWKENFLRVEQFMTTDVFTVHEDEVVDLVANLMDWRHIKHVPVEDDTKHLVGLVSYRSLLRFLAHDLPHGNSHPIAVREIMQNKPITVGPDTLTVDAIDTMRRHQVSCLPVVRDGKLVGIVTERDFLNMAAELVEARLRGS